MQNLPLGLPTPTHYSDISQPLSGKPKTIFKQAKQSGNNSQSSHWSRYQKGVFVRWLLRTLSRNMIIQKCFYQRVSQQIQKSPRNVYNFHLKLLSQYRTNERIISSLLGNQFVKQKQAKLQKTPSYAYFDLSKVSFDFSVPTEVNFFINSFLSSELNFMEAICLIEKTPESDFDHFYDIQICEYDMDSGQIAYQNSQIQCE